MQQTTLISQTGSQNLDEGLGLEPGLHPARQAACIELCSSRFDTLRRWAWLGARLSTSFLSRSLNLCEFGAEAFLCMMPRIHSFAGMDFDPMTAPQETASFHSGELLGDRDLLGLAGSPALAGSQSKLAISWRTPWLYLVFLLLAWLLLF